MEHFDVLIIGAGLSGVGAAYHMQAECPTKTLAILEARQAMGGTWDLFRYPGVRSDSDMFTLGFPFRPWRHAQAIADGAAIRAYIEETAAEFGIDRCVRYGEKVTGAAWEPSAARWTVHTDSGTAYTCGFLYMCSGYYSYEAGYEPEFPGRARFAGPVVHPQKWPAHLDYAGRQVVVVGSGATAVTLVPAMAETAGHVTMLQRSPSYIATLPGVDPLARAFDRYLPPRLAGQASRLKSIVLTQAFYQFCRRRPEAARRLLQKMAAAQLPEGYALDPDFVPAYDPWDQRMCVVRDGDLFAAIRAGRASVVTGRIDTFTESGIRLESGRELPADIIVTATGLNLVALGGTSLTVDGRPVRPGATFVYRGCMLSGVPNLAFSVGYTNASWTLRADLSARYVCRVLTHMDRNGYSVVVPTRPTATPQQPRPLLDLTSGYVQRALDILPKQGDRPPWRVRQNYILDYFTARFGDVKEDVLFLGDGIDVADGATALAGA